MRCSFRRLTLSVAAVATIMTATMMFISVMDTVQLDEPLHRVSRDDPSIKGHSLGQGRDLHAFDDYTDLMGTQSPKVAMKSPTTADPAEHVLRVLLAGHRLNVNETSIVDARRTVDELKSVVQHIENQLNQQFPSPSTKSPATRFPTAVPDPPGLDFAAEALVQSDGASVESKQHAKATMDHYLKLVSGTDMDETVGKVLLKTVELTSGANRRPRPLETISSPVLHRSNRYPWKQFENNIRQYALYRPLPPSSSNLYGLIPDDDPKHKTFYVDRLLHVMATLPIVQIDEMPDKGTQIKLVFKLSDGTKVLFKPMRISKDAEANPNHYIFNDMERHHAEIAAFHLDRLFDFRRVPPVAGRYINMTSELIPIADRHLSKTFYVSPAGNLCFFGECKYYCDSHHAVCGKPDTIEGSMAVYLPRDNEDVGDPYPRKTWPNPWAGTYSKRGKLPRWKTNDHFCDEVRSEPPYDSGRRLLDVIDMAIFDFMIGNLDRHHYYTFKRFDNSTFPILTDNGRGFGRSRKDDIELLAPLFQCCMIRSSTLEKIVQFAGLTSENAPLLSDMMRQSLTSDVIKGVLNNNHLMALDRRVRAVAIIVFDCINRTLTETGKVDGWRQVVLDDGF